MNNNELLANDITITPISAQLFSFYVAYYTWLQNGAKLGGVFLTNIGLCANSYDFFEALNVDSEFYLAELHAAFIAEGLDRELPFNENRESYTDESTRGECHLNSARIGWIERQIAKYVSYVAQNQIREFK